MAYYNIFQGNELITNTICNALGIAKTREIEIHGFQSFYFEAFFYLTKRFGIPEIFDDLKDAANWRFLVKNYIIWIQFDSISINFMVFGNERYKNYSMRTPYWVARQRRAKRFKKDDFFTFIEEDDQVLTEKEISTNQKILEQFCKEYGIDDAWTPEDFRNNNMRLKFFQYTMKYHDEIMGVDYDTYEQNYGLLYENAKTRHALKTLKQFLHNMLTPIYVRDADFNILGRRRRSEEFEKYRDNIKIERI